MEFMDAFNPGMKGFLIVVAGQEEPMSKDWLEPMSKVQKIVGDGRSEGLEDSRRINGNGSPKNHNIGQRGMRVPSLAKVEQEARTQHRGTGR